MKTLRDYSSGRTFKNVEILVNAEDLPRDRDFITSMLDDDTMIRYSVYTDTNGFYYAVSEDD